MSEPRVTRIRVEYDDGSVDEMDQLPPEDMSLYDLRRQRPDQAARGGRLGAHTSGAISALLFLTALHGQRRVYSELDPEVIKLARFFAP